MGSKPSTLSSVDDTMNQLIFHPPATDNECVFQKLTIPDYTGVNGLNGACKYELIDIHLITHPSSEKWIVFAHGNASDISSMLSFCNEMSDELEANVMLFDYVGYGTSKGSCSEEGCYEALQCVVDYMIDDLKITASEIFLVGQSLGTGVVSDFAYRNQWKNPIMLISPYKSIVSVVSECSASTSSFTAKTSSVQMDKFCTLDKIGKITCPVKIIHGENDELIDVSHGKTLFDNLPNKSLKPVWLPRTGHNDILHKIPLSAYKELFNY